MCKYISNIQLLLSTDSVAAILLQVFCTLCTALGFQRIRSSVKGEALKMFSKPFCVWNESCLLFLYRYHQVNMENSYCSGGWAAGAGGRLFSTQHSVTYRVRALRELRAQHKHVFPISWHRARSCQVLGLLINKLWIEVRWWRHQVSRRLGRGEQGRGVVCRIITRGHTHRHCSPRTRSIQ